MKKKENTLTTELHEVSEKPESDTTEMDVPEKPKRGRKPRAKKQDTVESGAGEASPETTGGTAKGSDPENTAEPVPEVKNTTDKTGNTSNTESDSSETDSAPSEDAASTEISSELEKEEAPPQDTAATEPKSVMETDMGKPESKTISAMASAPIPDVGPVTQIIESPMKLLKQEFQLRTQKIKEEMRNIQDSFLVIGFQLHWIRENNMFRVLNYKNIYEYAEKEFGVKKTTCCNFISIIENYAERDANGNVIESIADCYKNYSSSQLIAMLGMPLEMQHQVTPDMSVRAITRLRKGEPEKPVIGAEPSPAVSGMAAKSPEPTPTGKTHTEPEATEDFLPTEEIPDTVQTSDTVSTPEPLNAQQSNGEESMDAGCGTAEETEEAADTPENSGMDDTEETSIYETAETLMELDSNNYLNALEKLDDLLKNIFSAHASARIKIVYEQT